MIASVAATAEQQRVDSEEINRAVDEINQIWEENTEGMFRSSTAIQDLSRMAQELNRVMKQIKT